MTNKKRRNILEEPEYGIDSRYTSDKERKSDSNALMQARLIRIKNLSEAEIIRAKLMQLKLKMEYYLKTQLTGDFNNFSEFLKSYVDAIYTKRINFANDIGITPVLLSQVINHHREPKDEFLKRLMIHSEKAYENVCDFESEIWFQVYFQQKISDTMSNQKKWRSEVEKHVKLSETMER